MTARPRRGWKIDMLVFIEGVSLRSLVREAHLMLVSDLEAMLEAVRADA